MEDKTRVALCHEWITTYGGSEQVAQRIARTLRIKHVYTFTLEPQLGSELFPDATVQVAGRIGGTSLARRRWQWFLPVMGRTWSHLDLSDFDVVVTSAHAAVNAIRVKPGAVHISYCHTPMRYAWEWRSEIGRLPLPLRPVWPGVASLLRKADRKWASGVTRFVANSRYVADRIKRFYGRESDVIHPPVDTSYWCPEQGFEKDDYFLVAGRLVPYKKPDVAVRAATSAGAPLVVAGSGPELPRLMRLAGPTVRFIERPSNPELRDLYRGARALVFPGVEDFGMTPVEAQACGTPVLAYAEGGVLESVVPDTTGLLYDDASVEGLTTAMEAFDSARFDPEKVRGNALRFDGTNFDKAFKSLLTETVG